MMASAASAQEAQTQTETPATATAAPTAPAATAQTQPADTQAQVQQLVSAELPKYDADKSGDLNETEFSAWVLELRSNAEKRDPNTPKADAAAKAQWAKDTFASADTNKDQKIDSAEATTYFADPS